jgi:hypothetical protein
MTRQICELPRLNDWGLPLFCEAEWTLATGPSTVAERHHGRLQGIDGQGRVILTAVGMRPEYI